VTFQLLRYTRDGRFVHAGAHEDMIVLRKGVRWAEQIETPGMWLGGRADFAKLTEDHVLELRDGDLLVLYTDGMTEARNAAGRMFDVQRLCSAVEELRERPVSEICQGLLDRVRGWMHIQDDDMSTRRE
jgi:phosphoserine phosphatase RsbU/P